MNTIDTRGAGPVLGLLGGLGVGAAIHYYRELAAAHDRRGRSMSLVMVHASIARATDYASKGDRRGLATYLAALLEQLKGAGAGIGILPAVTPHICIDELQAIAPLPVIDLTKVVADHMRERRLSRVALFGTRFVVESDLYGRLAGVDVVRPREPELELIHHAYTQMAHTGVAPADHREQFVALADTLRQRDGVDAVVLAGTDFALMFNDADTPFPHVDCTRAHIDVIMRAVE
ncbi:MAG: aspartate/glutamate racemase family protein [Vicinamibacterales bacterium]